MTRKKREIYDDLPPRDHPDYMKLYRERKITKEKQKEYYKNYKNKNPNCHREKYDPDKAKEYRDSNKSYFAEKNWERHGILDLTYEKFQRTIEEQENKCACCGEHINSKPQADHCHNTGLFRSVLCPSCNMGLGIYEKKRELFEMYLDKYGKLLTDSRIEEIK